MEKAAETGRDDDATGVQTGRITRVFPYALLFAGACSVIATIWFATTERIAVEQTNALAQTSARAELQFALMSNSLSAP